MKHPCFFLSFFAAAVHSAEFRAGAATSNITPELGSSINGGFQGGWDHHGHLPRENDAYCHHTDCANAALITDLKRRGLLDDTLVVWSGEFGRTDVSGEVLRGILA
jgi:hypothetical protein